MFNEIYQTESGDLFQGMSSEVFGKALQHASYSDVLGLRNKKYRGTMVLEKASVRGKEKASTREAIHAKLTRIEAMIAEAERLESAKLACESRFQDRLAVKKAEEQERLSAEKVKQQQEERLKNIRIENNRNLERQANRLFVEEIKRITGLT